jgi:hypothetical protein
MVQPMTCPKCAGHMESGFMLDRAPGGANLQSKWLEGPPTPSFFLPGGRVKMQGREPVPVTTFRCDGCGYLESFAIEQPT